jgi:hypothetical protein
LRLTTVILRMFIFDVVRFFDAICVGLRQILE